MANKLLADNKKKIVDATADIRAYVNSVIDASSFVETDAFVSGKSFLDGSEAAGEGVLTGYATVGGRNVAIVAQNVKVLGGSFSRAGATKILKCIKNAIKKNMPLISVLDSRGARLGEGVDMLEGYAEVIAASAELKNYVPHIAIIKGNAVGLAGVYAATADFVFMGAESVLSLGAPQAVIAAAGMNKKAVDVLGVKNYTENNSVATFTFKDIKEVGAKIVSLFNLIDEPIADSTDDPNRTAAALNNEVTADGVLSALCDDKKYIELFAEFGKSVKTVLASVNNVPVGVVAFNANGKGGALCSKCMKKVKKFIKILTAYDIPLITVVDSEGVKSTLEQEEDGIVLSAARLISKIAQSDIPKISVISGKAIGFAYAAFASKGVGFEYTLAFPDAVIAPVSAEIAVATADNTDEIRAAKDPVALKAQLKERFEAEEANPFVSAKDGYVDNIIEPALIRPYIASILATIAG